MELPLVRPVLPVERLSLRAGGASATDAAAAAIVEDGFIMLRLSIGDHHHRPTSSTPDYPYAFHITARGHKDLAFHFASSDEASFWMHAVDVAVAIANGRAPAIRSFQLHDYRLRWVVTLCCRCRSTRENDWYAPHCHRRH